MARVEVLLHDSHHVELFAEWPKLVEKWATAKNSPGSPTGWNVADDFTNPIRNLGRFIGLAKGGISPATGYLVRRGIVPKALEAEFQTNSSLLRLADAWPLRSLPFDTAPQLAVSENGEAARILRVTYLSMFQASAERPDSPRSAALRGKLNDAVGALTTRREELDQTIEAIRRRPNLAGEATKLAAEVDRLQAEQARASRNGDAPLAQAAVAKLAPIKAEFAKAAQMFALRELAPAQAADSLYESALAIHEKAARAGPGQPAAWANAADWWKRFLDAYPQARRRFPNPARDEHARALRAEAEAKAKK